MTFLESLRFIRAYRGHMRCPGVPPLSLQRVPDHDATRIVADSWLVSDDPADTRPYPLTDRQMLSGMWEVESRGEWSGSTARGEQG